MRENDAIGVKFTPSRAVAQSKTAVSHEKRLGSIYACKFMRVETHEVIYEASVPRVHTY